MNDKKRYEVQLNEYIDYGDGDIRSRVLKTYKTWAVSSKQAIRNLEFRTGINQYNCETDLPGDGVRQLFFTAKALTVEEESEIRKNWENQIYITCGYCGYNNERERLERYKACLNCHKPLGDKDYFQKMLSKKMEELD